MSAWGPGEFEAFTKARLAEAEAAARDLLRTAQNVSLELKDPALLGRHMPGWHSWPEVEAVCAGRLADIAAMRAILDLHAPNSVSGTGRACAYCGHLWPCAEVSAVVSVWSDHQAYRGPREQH